MSRGVDLAWLAGFFEGEGCITIGPKLRSPGMVNISQQNEMCITRVLVLCKKLKLPKPYIQLPTKNSFGFCLWWYTLKGTKFLQAVHPYLRHPHKLARADIYLRFFAPERKKEQGRTEERLALLEEWKLQRQREKHAKEELYKLYVENEECYSKEELKVLVRK